MIFEAPFCHVISWNVLHFSVLVLVSFMEDKQLSIQDARVIYFETNVAGIARFARLWRRESSGMGIQFRICSQGLLPMPFLRISMTTSNRIFEFRGVIILLVPMLGVHIFYPWLVERDGFSEINMKWMDAHTHTYLRFCERTGEQIIF